ncbi:multiple epidermal growth factor-like domains protein 6 isoform X2 [Physella acuta]|uniref:multiple epidermal growth factor-like domains protein 6 isoform X2 n=1 Tax=Physella acuta TaxID=109671 RepID=UPI0027DD4F96|nr:multiple epidermal growth factor-like domains protein 6 isoform X2 [Physella acuta]
MSSRVIVSLLALPLILFWICSTTDAGHGDLCVTDSNCTELDDNSTCRFSQSCDSTASCTGVCACVEGFTHVNGSCVKIRLGDPCTSNTSCNSSVENSACVNGTCECGGEYVMKHENVCSVRLLGDKCLKTADCNATVMYSQCHKQTKICRCPRFFVQVNNNTCKPVVDAPCSSDEMCMSIPNATCSKCPTSQPCVRRCQCFDGFTKVNGSCVKLKIGDGCELFPGKNCSQTISNSECKNETCQCSGGYKHRQDVCLLRVVGDNCSHNEDCEAAVDRSFCNSSSSTCQCLQGYISRGSGVACDRVKIGDQCKSHEDCNKSVRNSRCTDNFCICLKDYSSNRNKTHCLERLLGDPCEDETSCANVKESTCNQTCVCRPGFKPNSRRRCEKRQLGDLCTSHLDCANACGGNACACTSGKCSKAALEETNCSTNYDCMELFNNSFCDNSTCHCNVNLAPDPAFQKCVFYNLGHVCSETKNRCEYSVNNSVCFNKTCQCKDTHYPMNNSICSIKQIGGLKCESNTQCKVNNSFCEMNNTCKCKVGYRQEGFDACVLASLYDECTKPEDCNTTILHSDCDHGRCRCLPGYTPNITTTTSSCEMRTLGSGCKHSFDCSSVIENSVCVQCGPNTSDPQTCLTCQCKAGYIAKGNQCAPRVLSDPCTNDSDCSVHVPNAVCVSKRCRCGGGYLQTRNNTFCPRKKIGDFCYTGPNDDCSKAVDNSVCTRNGTKAICLCKSGYQVDASMTLCRRRRIREQTCAVDLDCRDAVNMSHCASGVCVCDHGYATNLDRDACHRMRLHTDTCTAESECSTAVDYSTCVNGKCACVSGFYSENNNTGCLKRKIGIGKCDVHVDCSDAVNNSECRGLCRCMSGYMTRNDDATTCHRRVIYDNCTLDTDCSDAVADTICRGRRCVCSLGFYASADNTTCIKRKLGDRCSFNLDCQMVTGSSGCANGTCVCSQGYDGHANSTQCVKAPERLGSECEYDEQCSTRFPSSIGHSTCSPATLTCVCPNGTFVSRDAKACVKLPQKIGDYCADDTHCSRMANNTICNTTSMTSWCQCASGYFLDNNSSACHKLPTALGDVCNQNEQCSVNITHSSCERGRVYLPVWL